jgi:hypothetical protein
MDVAPLLGLAGLLFLKEAGLPLPVPGDLLVLGAGSQPRRRRSFSVTLAGRVGAARNASGPRRGRPPVT